MFAFSRLDPVSMNYFLTFSLKKKKISRLFLLWNPGLFHGLELQSATAKEKRTDVIHREERKSYWTHKLVSDWPSQQILKAIYILRVFLLSDPISYRQKYQINHLILLLFGRHDGIMVSSLNSGSRGLGSKPSQVIVWCS